MSTGDYVRQLRAVKGGPTPVDIEQAIGLTPGTYRQLEQRYRAIGTEEDLAKLAEYFQVPVEELTTRQRWTRKDLSAALVEAAEQDRAIRLDLRTGDSLTGKVIWSDLGAALLHLDDGRELVVQRHIVDRWELLEA
jgi:transcriptional regulator with XRE-family HTH domain